MGTYKTSEIAKAVGVHPNTIRNYEKWELILPVPRAKNGYRIFSETHLNQAILVKMAFNSTWLSGGIRQSALRIIELTGKMKLNEALSEGKRHLQLIIKERKLAEDAITYLEDWAEVDSHFTEEISLSRTEAAEYLGVTKYMLRGWERNRLISVPRNPDNGYRVYGPEELNRLKVIRMLRKANYSIMSILRMLSAFDQGRKNNFQKVLDNLEEDQDIFFATDRWLSTLDDLQENAANIINHLKNMIDQY